MQVSVQRERDIPLIKRVGHFKISGKMKAWRKTRFTSNAILTSGG